MRGLLIGLACSWWTAVMVTASWEDTLVWPTPNPAFTEGQPYEDFVQPTASGQLASGLFGCTRNDGRRFHEGLDLFPIQRDRRGEATDRIFAVAAGVVRHINSIAGRSGYGIYVVLEHPEASPAVYTLYSHLRRVEPGIKVGQKVKAGQTLGTMGRTAAGYVIPRERAHLHFEMGLRLTDSFQAWYDQQAFTVPNHHGAFNGFNLVGFDYLDFLELRRAGHVKTVLEYLQRQPVAVTVRLRHPATPEFLQLHPVFLEPATAAPPPAGWEIDLTWYGLPIRWQALPASSPGLPAGDDPVILFHDALLLERHPCHAMVRHQGGRLLPGSRLTQTLEILFAR